MTTTGPSLPSADHVLRLRPAPEAIFQAIAPIHRLYMHARNIGAELAAIQPLGMPLLDEDSGSVFFPEGGLNLDLTHLKGVHAVRIDKLLHPAPAVEFDFEERSCALSLVALDESADYGPFVEDLRALGESAIPHAELNRWRSELDPPPCLCPHCSQAADRRVLHATRHPLTLILEEASVLHLPLMCRIQSPHLGMVTRLIPGRAKLRNGCIEVIDASGHGLLHIKLEYAHSLWVLPIRIDGEPWSAIRVYDMLGQLNLEIATPDPAIERNWRSICEGDSTHYRAEPEI
ncbi:hypothetical protein KBB96_02600 [Luteolibacter ambystomatis]|uniref:Uncharacterized protein n=1 Tax=Luteolibacter ambystomatis TaxID=2824561 RepID=A0A975PF29_9BACT|nr:hypothetical protein [Luteolibacter ambystomatis]QUE51788.1 hypothetical protein KBB96_02600 [Luteolibacter ambystomatis]